MLNSLSLTSLTFVPSNLSQPMIQLLLMIHTKVLKTSLMTLLTKQKKLALKKSKLVLNLVLQKSCLAKLFQKKKKLASLFLELLVFLTLNVSLSVQWRITLSKMHHAMSSSFVNKIKKRSLLKLRFFIPQIQSTLV